MNETRQKNNNILLVANYKSDVGFAWWLMENFWAEIARHFERMGKRCLLLYPKVNSVPEIIRCAPIEIIEHDFSDRRIPSVLKLIEILRENQVGYVYLTDRGYYDWLYPVMKVAGIKKIVNHDHIPGERAMLPFHKKMAKKLVHQARIFSCDLCIGVSEFVKRRAIETACLPASKCTYIHNGIKLFDNYKTYYAHDRFDIPRDAKIIVTTGRATLYKGIDLLIRAARLLLEDHGVEDVYFLHVGDGPQLQEFKNMAMELGVDRRFMFAGFRTDISRILPSCEIGIQASTGEAFSLSILEYMCAGLATLAPNNCGNGEAIEDGVNGLLFSPGDVDDIVAKLLYVLNNAQFASRIKLAARMSVEDRFSIDKCNENLLALLDRQFA